MVSYKVTIDDQAKESISCIHSYLKNNASKSVADKVVEGILKTIDSLAAMPERNTIVEEISTEKAVYRRILKWSYKIIYRIMEEDLEVIVVEVFHERQDPSSVFKLIE